MYDNNDNNDFHGVNTLYLKKKKKKKKKPTTSKATVDERWEKIQSDI